MEGHKSTRYSSLSGNYNKKPPLNRLHNKNNAEKTNSDTTTFDKPSKLAANNIVYNANNTPKLKIQSNNKTSEDNMFSFTNNIGNKIIDKDVIKENKHVDYVHKKYSNKNIFERNLNSGLNDMGVYSSNSLEKVIKEMKEEILNLQMRGREKDKILREKDKLIKELLDKNRKLESEVTVLRGKANRAHERKEKNTEDEELALALAKIEEMERNQQSKNNTRSERSSSVQRVFQNPLGIDFHPSDVIDVDVFADPFFQQVFGGMNHHQVINPLVSNEIHDPLAEYEDHIINELCPNPDRMTYEQLLELEDKVGKVSKGLSKKEIEKIPSVKFNKQLFKNTDKCTVCQFEFNENEILRKLTCGHLYHKSCVDEWLQKEKTCPVCKMEVKLK